MWVPISSGGRSGDFRFGGFEAVFLPDPAFKISLASNDSHNPS